jgi:hypothetical protein
MTMTTWRNLGAALALALLLAGCPKDDDAGDVAATPAPPAATAPVAGEAPAAEDAPAAATDDIPETGTALPPPSIAIGEPNPGAPGVVDASCKTDADCAIKDVGSCCGYRPACVNSASPTFPEKVKADCQSSGRVSTCGFPAITGCKCTAGQCEGTGAGAGDKVQ